jgi:hypothetical protein
MILNISRVTSVIHKHLLRETNYENKNLKWVSTKCIQEIGPYIALVVQSETKPSEKETKFALKGISKII